VLGAWLAQRKSPAMYDAMNRHDVEGVLANLADDVTFVFPGDVWASGTFVGKKAVGEWFERFFQQFSTIHFAVQWVAVARLFDFSGDNVLVTHWVVRVTNREGFSARNRGISVVTLRRGKAVHIQDFIFDTGATFRAARGNGPVLPRRPTGDDLEIEKESITFEGKG